VSNLLKTNIELPKKTDEEEAENSPILYKTIAVDALGVLSAIALGYLFKQAILGETLPVIGVAPSGISLVVMTSIFLLASLFQIILIKNVIRNLVVIGLQIVFLALFLYDESARWMATVIASAVLFALGTWQARREMSNTLEIRFFRISELYFKKVILALSLMAVVFYFPHWQANPSFGPDALIDPSIDWVVGLTSQYYGEIDIKASMPVGDIIDRVSQAQFQRQYSNLIPIEERQAYLIQFKEQIMNQMKSILGLDVLEPTAKLNDVLKESISGGILKLQDKFKDWFFTGWTIIVLLFILSIGRVYVWIISIVAFLIYELLIILKFIHIYVQPFNKEIIDF